MNQAEMFRPKVIEIELADRRKLPLWQCPECGYIADDWDFDCLGAEEDCVFCNGCDKELST